VTRQERDQRALKDAVKTLATILARAEQRAAKEPRLKQGAKLVVKEVRAHYASGKSLLED